MVPALVVQLPASLPILAKRAPNSERRRSLAASSEPSSSRPSSAAPTIGGELVEVTVRSEEHTSELQSQSNIVCRLLLEKKKNKMSATAFISPFFPQIMLWSTKT